MQLFSETPDVELATEATKPRQSDEEIASVRAGGEELASIEAALAALEVQREILSKRREKLAMEELPTRMMELRIPSIGLPEVTPEQWLRDGAAKLQRAALILSGDANDEEAMALRNAILDAIKTPEEVQLKLEDWAHANIAADWEPERREKAFEWLKENGCEGMLQTVVTVKFVRGESELVEKVVSALEAELGGVERIQVVDGVPWTTLTAFVRDEYFEKKREDLPLELLGARVGKRARLSKEKKKRR